MKLFKNIIQNNLQGNKVLLFFIITTCIYLIMVLITIPKVMSYASGMQLLDMMPIGYNLEYASTLFKALGQEGREAYLHKQIPLDMVYPGLFSITYTLILAYFLNKIDRFKARLMYLCILPFVVGLMDYAENFGIISMLNTFPKISKVSVTITSSFSLLKSIGTTLYFLILLVVIIAFALKILKERKPNNYNHL